MRTTIDMPDALLQRAKRLMAKRNLTFRGLVIDALEQVLDQEVTEFHLRDASAGFEVKSGGVTTDTINEAIDQQRQPIHRP